MGKEDVVDIGPVEYLLIAFPGSEFRGDIAPALADLVDHIEDEKITTVYAETLVPQDTADTIARETGAEVAVLDPIEGLTDASAGDDYVSVMRSNLETVREGQGCS